LDSTLALLVAERTFRQMGKPATDIMGISMPCFGTTSRTKSNAETLCDILKVSFKTIDITKSVSQHLQDIGHDGTTPDVTLENAQARERTQVLMDMTNLISGLVIGTGDLSELALGWCTYNGDHMSMYSVNCSIPKTLVRHLVRYIADSSGDEKLKKVLYDIVDTPVSPELLPSDGERMVQKTEDLIGPYELHDFFLYYFVRYGFTPKKILYLAEYAFKGIYDADTIKKWLREFLRRFFTQQFKRTCVPNGPKVGSVSLSPRGDWRMPSDAVSAMWAEDLK
ncbi:MAG: NAD(+) synthase, partial [Oscillospiraceae bacterium]